MRMPRKQIKLTISQMLTIGVSLIAVILIFSMAQKSVDCQQKQGERDVLAGEVAQIEARADRLREQLHENKSSAVIESSLREDFGLIGQSEGALLLEYDEPAAEEQRIAPAESAQVKSRPPHWVEWVDSLVNP